MARNTFGHCRMRAVVCDLIDSPTSRDSLGFDFFGLGDGGDTGKFGPE